MSKLADTFEPVVNDVDFAGGQCDALFVGVTGDVVVPHGAGTVTFKNVQAGSILPIKVKKVVALGTTATNLVALYA